MRLRFGLYIVGLLTRLKIWGYVSRKGMRKGTGWRIEDEACEGEVEMEMWICGWV